MIAGADKKLPYGNLPRLLLAWISTEAVRTQSRVLVLGDSLSEFMRELGIYSTSGRGHIRLRNQMRRLFQCHVQLIYEHEHGERFVSSAIADHACYGTGFPAGGLRPGREHPARLPGPLGRLRAMVRRAGLLPRPGGPGDRRRAPGRHRGNRRRGDPQGAAGRDRGRPPRRGPGRSRRQRARETRPGRAGPGAGRADIALCVVLFYAGLRRSEAAALKWGDVEAAADGSGLLTVRRSKTDPEAEGSVRYLPRAAMEALEAIRPEDPGAETTVFGLSGRQIAKRVEAAAIAAGLGEGFSGHSGRVGLAAELSRAGASTHEIAAAGGWKSAGMVIRYTRRETARRGAVARYLEGRQDPPG